MWLLACWLHLNLFHLEVNWQSASNECDEYPASYKSLKTTFERLRVQVEPVRVFIPLTVILLNFVQ